MALADIAQKILAEIDQQIKGLEKELEAQKKALDTTYADKEKTALVDLDKKTEKALADVDHKIAAMARQENKKAMLGARRAVLDKAMDAFFQALCGADKSSKETIYKKLLDLVDVSSGDIVVAAADEGLVSSLVKGFNVKGDSNIAGGFLLNSGGAEIDNTFHNLVYSVYRDELEMYFANQLKLVG